MSKNYKEIIYLNTVELNSALSQLNEGLLESFIEKSNTTKATGEEAGKSAELEANFKIFKARIGASDKDTSTMETLFGEDKNIVLNDFKLESLLQESSPKTLEEANEGDFVLNKGTANINDFAFSESIFRGKNDSTLNSSFKSFMKDIGAWDKNTETGFKFLYHYLQYGNSLVQGNIVLSMDGLLSFVDNNNFRINSSERQSLAYTTRKISIFGVVEAIMTRNTDEVNAEFNELFDETNSSEIFTNIGKMVPKFTELTFLASGLLQKGDKLIRPIALYFD